MKTKSKKGQSVMAKGNERKDVVKTFRVSPEQEKQIKKNADAMGMMVGTYVTYAAVHGNSLTPETVVKIQNVLNKASAAVERYSPDEAKKIQKEGKKIWSSLK